MSNGFYQIPQPTNEPVKSYAVGSPERDALAQTYRAMYEQAPIDVPMYIGSELIRTSDKRAMTPPHEHQKVLGHFNYGDAKHVKRAIEEALKARAPWASMPWEHRAAIFLRAADLLAGPWRMRMNAATMLAQSKNAFQAEIDAACELIDFLR
ncbi:MAG: aldehyde dehydrogenase family protein, partial [Flavobacteriales bacterium]